LPSPQSHWQLADWLGWQEQLHPRGIDLGLDRVRCVAARLGLPDGRPRTLIIAGTNGKGSSATLASLIYRQAGYRVGLYTSPHLLRYNERVCIDGAPASDEDLCAAFAEIEKVRAGESLTYFEYGTLAALWLFRRAQVDVQVLEVGLGGRLDAVNIVDADCALITNIGLDHTDWLGPDRESIGREKAGILRAQRPGICAENQPPASILDAATAVGAPLAIAGRDFRHEVTGDGWIWRGARTRMSALPPPGLSGLAQYANAAGVLACVELLQSTLPVDEAAIRAALPALRLAGRFEQRGIRILDVAHNVEAAQVLVENLRAESIKGRIHLVLGMMRDKPVEAFCRTLSPMVARAYCAGLPAPRGLDGEELATRARAGGLEGRAFETVSSAVAAACREVQSSDRVLVTGSFLTVAAASAA
jgi:dihydrofolate synthase / folylpolyglutamate synthase